MHAHALRMDGGILIPAEWLPLKQKLGKKGPGGTAGHTALIHDSPTRFWTVDAYAGQLEHL